jgi:hypothetical protein
MKSTNTALIWAGMIIAGAYLAKDMGLSTEASLGLTMGLVGAAWGTMAGRRSSQCAKGCA